MAHYWSVRHYLHCDLALEEGLALNFVVAEVEANQNSHLLLVVFHNLTAAAFALVAPVAAYLVDLACWFSSLGSPRSCLCWN